MSDPLPETSTVLRVCIVGPDGAGKSTVADGIVERLDALGWQSVREKPRPTSIDAVTNKDFDYTDPHALSHRNLVRSLAKTAAKFGYVWTRTIRSTMTAKQSGHKSILLEERGWLDHGVDNLRYRMHPTAATVVRSSWRLVPQPDRTILLTGDPATIADRKQELTTTEVARQLDVWESMGRKGQLRDVLLIDSTSMSVDAAISAAVEHVVGS